MRQRLHVVTLLFVTFLCLTRAELDLTALATGPAGTTGAKVNPQTKSLLQSAASAESLLGIIEGALRGTSAVVQAPFAT